MAIPHLSSGEVTSIHPLGEKLAQSPTTALFKDERLEVMRVVLPAGKHMPAHVVAGPITVQCIEGEVDFVADSTHTVMQAGDFLYLAGGISHALFAISDTSLLVTIVL